MTQAVKKYNKVALFLAPLIGVNLENVEDIYVSKQHVNVVFVKTQNFITFDNVKFIEHEGFNYSVFNLFGEQIVVNANLLLGTYSEIPKNSANILKKKYGQRSVITYTIDKNPILRSMLQKQLNVTLNDKAELMSILSDEEFISSEILSMFTLEKSKSAKQIISNVKNTTKKYENQIR
jgi:hypothetical protein